MSWPLPCLNFRRIAAFFSIKVSTFFIALRICFFYDKMKTLQFHFFLYCHGVLRFYKSCNLVGRSPNLVPRNQRCSSLEMLGSACFLLTKYLSGIDVDSKIHSQVRKSIWQEQRRYFWRKTWTFGFGKMQMHRTLIVTISTAFLWISIELSPHGIDSSSDISGHNTWDILHTRIRLFSHVSLNCAFWDLKYLIIPLNFDEV